MNSFKKILSFFFGLITILLQGAAGMLAGTLAVGMTQGQMPLSLLFTGVGIWIGVFLVGAVALALRRKVRPRKYLLRLLVSLAGVVIPIAILIFFGAAKGYDNPTISDGLGLQMTILAAVLGILGFYAPGWFGRKKEDEAVG